MTDIFNNDTPKLDQFVGEGKKYSDSDAVAKALVEKDTFIQRLLDEKRQLEADFKAAQNLQAYNDRIAALEARAQVERVEPTPPTNAPSTPTPSGVDEATVQRLIEQREASQKRTRNLLEVKDKLTEVFGDDYPTRVKAQAQALGIDMAKLNELAAETPSAFYALIGLDRPAQRAGDVAPPATQVNSASQFNANVGKKNNKYYSELRRTKPNEYYTPRIAMEEFNELKRQGPAFYEP
jgi:hypothetical protein